MSSQVDSLAHTKSERLGIGGGDAEMTGRCSRCRRSGHRAADCYARTDVDGLVLGDDDRADADDGRTYSVYVIRLEDGAVYVGQTGKTVEVRFQEHRDGYKAGRVRGRSFVTIWKRQCVRGLSSRSEAERLERQKARELRRAGYEVFGGH